MWEITTFFYDTCVPRDGDDKQESPSPVERGKNCVPLEGGKGPLAGREFARLSAHVHFYLLL